MEHWRFVSYVFFLSLRKVDSIHFVTISYRGGSLGYEALTPAFDVAFEQGKQKYQLNYTWTNYELTNSTSFCDDDALAQALIPTVDLYRRHRLMNNRPVIIYFPGCSFPFSPVGDFAREMDWLAIVSGPLNEQWLDAKRYTNTIRYGATESVLLGQAFLLLLDFYSWRRLSIIVDAQNGDHRGLNIRTLQQCMPILGLLRRRAADFNFLQIDTDTTDPKANISRTLLKAKAHSRVILLCTSVQPFQRFLNVARELNMTSSHVFVFVFGLEVSEERYFDLDQLKNDAENTKQLFQNVLVIRTPAFPWTEAAPDIQLIKQRKRSDSTFAADMFSYNEFMMNSFDAVQSTMIVLNETCKDDRTASACTSGRQLADRFSGRTFELPLQPAIISKSGNRILFADLQYYDTSNFSFETFFTFSSQVRHLRGVQRRSIWSNSSRVPSDLPVCGLHGEFCIEPSMFVQQLAAGVGATLAVGAVLAVVYYLRISHLAHLTEDRWWRVDEDENPLRRLRMHVRPDLYRSAMLYSRYGPLLGRTSLDIPLLKTPFDKVQFDFSKQLHEVEF